MTQLSVNLNKFALIRNSRTGNTPDLLRSARVVIDSGCQGLTLHPRADARHALLTDVSLFGEIDEVKSGQIELNIEGDLRPELLQHAKQAGAQQFTVVPVIPGEKTSSRGWQHKDNQKALRDAVAYFKGKTRVSVFCDATEESVTLAAAAGAQAVEFYTGDYAQQFGTQTVHECLAQLKSAADVALAAGLRVHAGHDLDTENLPQLLRLIPIHEVSIGHAITTEALYRGLDNVLKEYLQVIKSSSSTLV